MEEKRREAGNQPAATSSAAAGVDSPASEPASSRRRAGGQKRKATALSTANASSTPSKRITREKNLISNPQIYNHNGPLTRARQGPSSLTGSAGYLALHSAGRKLDSARDDARLEAVEELNKASEHWEALEAKIEADYETIRSRDTNVHVVPTHCGWFSWTSTQPLEEQGLPSFFNGKSQIRTPDMYMEIRNWIMKKFHTNPNTQIELKDLLELEVGCLEDKQEVMEFLDFWGLINFHPFPPVESTLANADSDKLATAENDEATKKDSSLYKLYQFEEIQSYPPVAPKPNIVFPAVPSGLFPESSTAEELVKPEGPAVEYHCNSCSADCSRKRYHCQKQADFDLCSDCFNDGKFGSGMSSTDFILMVPAEAAGASGGKWTDQETLLLLEALELYRENWNEIAEHVATKTKAQCILHFVQMPIEDVFLNYDDSIGANSKEAAESTVTNADPSVPKDGPETSESKTGANEGQTETFPMETSKTEDASDVKGSQETLKPEDGSKVKVGEEISKSKDTSEVKGGQASSENIALKALREAFEAVGYLPTPEIPRSFAEVGNPVMALAEFLALLVGPDNATASARGAVKSISGSSPALQLAARHCFILEDPPGDKKEQAHSESVVAEMADGDTQKDEDPENTNHKEDNTTSMLEGRDLSNDHSDKITEDSVPEEKRTSSSSNDKSSDELQAVKDPGNKTSPEKFEPGDLNELSNQKLSKDSQPSTVEESNDFSKIPSSSVKELGEGNSVEESSLPAESAKDVDLLSDTVPSERNEAVHPVASNSVVEPSQPSKATRDIDTISDPLPSENNEPEQPVTASSKADPSEPMEVPKDVNMVSSTLPSEPNEPKQTDSVMENGTTTGEDQTRDSQVEKHDRKETKDNYNIDKIKRAAGTALAAAAVKAKLLANQEEDQILQLAASVIEKQLQKLEAKLAFFNEIDNVTLRVREQLERSRQRLYHERAQIIAARLGSSRPMPPSIPANRMLMNVANAVARPPMSMNSPRPLISRPMGTVAPTTSNSFVSTNVAGSSIRPPNQDKLSSVGTK